MLYRWDETELTLQDLNRKDAISHLISSRFKGVVVVKLDAMGGWILAVSTSPAALSYLKRSTLCFNGTYLADVSGINQFLASQWFTRDWTLQELLAPKYLIVF